jgi:hypothetical protein
MTTAASAAGDERWTTSLAGLVALAVAMGIGRFAFTPILPLMLRDGLVDLPAGSWLASANYLGYLVGALGCTLQPWAAERLVRAGLALPPLDAPRLVRFALATTIVLTGAMALPWPVLWPVLRFLAGVASAMAMVYSVGWCLARLAGWGAAGLGGVVFAGPGAGIVLSGVVASLVVAGGGSSRTAWAVFGSIAALLTALVWRIFVPAHASRSARGEPSTPRVTDAPVASGRTTEIALLAFAYGLAGFGYIITATFLPVIARQAMPGSPWIDLFWPLFGGAVVVGALLSTRLPLGGDLRRLLALTYAMQAAGILVSLLWPSLGGFIVGSLLLGLPFTTITFLGMQEVRRLAEHQAASRFGLLTALYGLGQIAGPALVAELVRHSSTPAAGFDRALGAAVIALLLGAVLYLAMQRLFPMRSASTASAGPAPQT